MIKGSLARRYARALMAIGKERKIYEEIGREIESFASLVREDKNLRQVLTDPLFNHDIKEKIILEITSRLGLSELAVNFLKLLNDKRRLDSLLPIVEAYRDMADEASGRLRAEVTAAGTLSEIDQDRVKAALGKLTGKQVIMQIQTDPEIIGGMITRIGGKLYDGSIRTQLKKIRESLAESD